MTRTLAVSGDRVSVFQETLSQMTFSIKSSSQASNASQTSNMSELPLTYQKTLRGDLEELTNTEQRADLLNI